MKIRSPFSGPAVLVLVILLLGWWKASYRPVSFGWMGNPRGDGYLAVGSVILDLTSDSQSGWSFYALQAVPLEDLTELDYSGYRNGLHWWSVRFGKLPDVPDGYHFHASFPALIATHLAIWGGMELAWRRRRKSRITDFKSTI